MQNGIYNIIAFVQKQDTKHAFRKMSYMCKYTEKGKAGCARSSQQDRDSELQGLGWHLLLLHTCMPLETLWARIENVILLYQKSKHFWPITGEKEKISGLFLVRSISHSRAENQSTNGNTWTALVFGGLVPPLSLDQDPWRKNPDPQTEMGIGPGLTCPWVRYETKAPTVWK